MSQTIAFIAFKQFDNLGVGYLASVMSDAGYRYVIIDPESDIKDILNILKKEKPLLIGFSVIFQYYIQVFATLAASLRDNGIICHFNAGGHFASLKPEELFELMPAVDSIVRFEGEFTFLELVNALNSGNDWRSIKGIAFRREGVVIENPLRPPEKDIDLFPFPVRSPLEEYVLGRKFATIIAGRGCNYNCSFCSNRQYYKKSGGPFKRIRNPEMVAAEMEFLYKKQECTVFLFLDDDFPVNEGKNHQWVRSFCMELKKRDLIGKIIWKINCRPDEIDRDIFRLMKRHGLYLVFIGLDDGTDDGLKNLNKQMTVKESVEGINILKDLEIGLDYGFMLFQPSTSFEKLKNNLGFLKRLCSDGYTPVTFLKLMPYAETRIESELLNSGRLKGPPGFRDYDFSDPLLNDYYRFIKESFTEWLNSPDGFANVSKWARNYISVFFQFYGPEEEVKLLQAEVRKNTAEGNLFLINKMNEVEAVFHKGMPEYLMEQKLLELKRVIDKTHNRLKKSHYKSIIKILRLKDYIEILRMVTPGNKMRSRVFT